METRILLPKCLKLLKLNSARKINRDQANFNTVDTDNACALDGISIKTKSLCKKNQNQESPRDFKRKGESERAKSIKIKKKKERPTSSSGRESHFLNDPLFMSDSEQSSESDSESDSSTTSDPDFKFPGNSEDLNASNSNKEISILNSSSDKRPKQRRAINVKQVKSHHHQSDSNSGNGSGCGSEDDTFLIRLKNSKQIIDSNNSASCTAYNLRRSTHSTSEIGKDRNSFVIVANADSNVLNEAVIAPKKYSDGEDDSHSDSEEHSKRSPPQVKALVGKISVNAQFKFSQVQICAGRIIEKGTILSPNEGDVIIENIRDVPDIKRDDIRFIFGCFDRIIKDDPNPAVPAPRDENIAEVQEEIDSNFNSSENECDDDDGVQSNRKSKIKSKSLKTLTQKSTTKDSIIRKNVNDTDTDPDPDPDQSGSGSGQIRICNWVRLVKEAPPEWKLDNPQINVVASIVDGQPLFEFTKNVSIGNEIIVYFDISSLSLVKSIKEEDGGRILLGRRKEESTNQMAPLDLSKSLDPSQPLKAKIKEEDLQLEIIKTIHNEETDPENQDSQESHSNTINSHSSPSPCSSPLPHAPRVSIFPFSINNVLQPGKLFQPYSSHPHSGPPPNSTPHKNTPNSSNPNIQNRNHKQPPNTSAKIVSNNNRQSSRCVNQVERNSNPLASLVSQSKNPSQGHNQGNAHTHYPTGTGASTVLEGVRNGHGTGGNASLLNFNLALRNHGHHGHHGLPMSMSVNSMAQTPSNQMTAMRPILRTRGRERSLLPCEVCGKAFDRPSLLKRHMRTHTGEKPHICDVCSKGFSTSSSLNTHRRIHSGEKPHQCPICGKRFTASSNLYYHRMTHNKEKPHKCLLCGKSFPTPGDLKSHQYVHSGSWPYNCPVCHRGFSKQTNLRNHLLLHSGDKPHNCQVCGKKFALACNLRAHLRTHEEEPIASCISCKRTFLSSLNMLDNGQCRACILHQQQNSTNSHTNSSNTNSRNGGGGRIFLPLPLPTIQSQSASSSGPCSGSSGSGTKSPENHNNHHSHSLSHNLNHNHPHAFAASTALSKITGGGGGGGGGVNAPLITGTPLSMGLPIDLDIDMDDPNSRQRSSNHHHSHNLLSSNFHFSNSAAAAAAAAAAASSLQLIPGNLSSSAYLGVGVGGGGGGGTDHLNMNLLASRPNPFLEQLLQWNWRFAKETAGNLGLMQQKLIESQMLAAQLMSVSTNSSIGNSSDILKFRL